LILNVQKTLFNLAELKDYFKEKLKKDRLFALGGLRYQACHKDTRLSSVKAFTQGLGPV
jgi:hypothetical protein